MGQLEDAGSHRCPLGFVAVEQLGRRLSLPRQGQLPAQVVGVLQPGVHPLSGSRIVDMGGVPRQKDRALAVVGGHALVSPEAGQPGRLGDRHPRRAPLGHQPAHLVKIGSGSLGGTVGDIGRHHPPSAIPEGEAGQHPPRAGEDPDLVLTQRPIHLNVGQQPVLVGTVAIERQTEMMAHRAVGPVAAHHVGRPDRLLTISPMADRRPHPVALLGQADELDASFDVDPEALEVTVQHQLRVELGHHQHEREPRLEVAEAQVQDPPTSGIEGEPPHPVAERNELVGQAELVQDLKTAGVHPRRPGFGRPRDRPFDDANLGVVASQLGRHHRSGRSGTHHENRCTIHRSSFPQVLPSVCPYRDQPHPVVSEAAQRPTTPPSAAQRPAVDRLPVRLAVGVSTGKRRNRPTGRVRAWRAGQRKIFRSDPVAVIL